MKRLLVFVLIVTLFGSCMESDSNENLSLTVYEDDFSGQIIEEGSEESKLITIDENGFVYFKNQLFNGTKRVYYPDSEISNQDKTDESRVLEYEISYKEGIKEGLWKSWYTNGQLNVETNFKDGRHDGLYRSWHYNGQLSQKTNYINGEEDGLHQEWYENGKLNTQGINKRGIKDGLWRIWYKNGQLMEEANYKENYPDGLNRSWYENGILASESNFKNHYLIGLF